MELRNRKMKYVKEKKIIIKFPIYLCRFAFPVFLSSSTASTITSHSVDCASFYDLGMLNSVGKLGSHCPSAKHSFQLTMTKASLTIPPSARLFRFPFSSSSLSFRFSSFHAPSLTFGFIFQIYEWFSLLVTVPSSLWRRFFSLSLEC